MKVRRKSKDLPDPLRIRQGIVYRLIGGEWVAVGVIVPMTGRPVDGRGCPV